MIRVRKLGVRRDHRAVAPAELRRVRDLVWVRRRDDDPLRVPPEQPAERVALVEQESGEPGQDARAFEVDLRGRPFFGVSGLVTLGSRPKKRERVIRKPFSTRSWSVATRIDRASPSARLIACFVIPLRAASSPMERSRIVRHVKSLAARSEAMPSLCSFRIGAVNEFRIENQAAGSRVERLTVPVDFIDRDAV
jgi:hypothetical protein